MSEATLRTYPPPKPNIALYKTKIDDRFETVQSSKNGVKMPTIDTKTLIASSPITSPKAKKPRANPKEPTAPPAFPHCGQPRIVGLDTDDNELAGIDDSAFKSRHTDGLCVSAPTLSTTEDEVMQSQKTFFSPVYMGQDPPPAPTTGTQPMDQASASSLQTTRSRSSLTQFTRRPSVPTSRTPSPSIEYFRPTRRPSSIARCSSDGSLSPLKLERSVTPSTLRMMAAAAQVCDTELEMPATPLAMPPTPGTPVSPPSLDDVHQVVAETSTVSCDDEEEEIWDEICPYRFLAQFEPPPLESPTPCLPRLAAKHRGRKTLILDLDETLVHSSTQEILNPEISFPVDFDSTMYTVSVLYRPGMHTFLEFAAAKFEVVVFTASHRVYADKLLDIIDPNHTLIHHRLFRSECTEIDGNYMKDLRVVGRPLENMLIIDNSPQAFALQIDNGMPIESWFEDPEDRCLLESMPFLAQVAEAKDVRTLLRQHYQIQDLLENIRAEGVEP